VTIKPLSAYDLAVPVDGRKGLLSTILRAGPSDKDAGTTFFVASTPDEDRALDVVRQDWRLRNYRANPVILDNHNSRRVVGRGEKATVAKSGDHAGNLTILVRWDIGSVDKAIAAIGDQHLNGFRSCGSVGFRIGKMTMRNKLPQDHAHFSEGREVDSQWGKYKVVGRYLERNELLEFSSATIPMNVGAAQQRSFLEELAGLDVDDVEARAKVTAQTVRNSIGDDLVAMVRGLDPEQRAALAGDLGELLWPDVLSRMVRDEDARKAIQTAVAMTRRGPEPEPEPEPEERSIPDWLEGSPLASVFTPHFTRPSAG